jgi:8-amino-7-oxononanoate synthase
MQSSASFFLVVPMIPSGVMVELPPETQSAGRVHVKSRGQRLLCFGGCDYFRLSTHSAVIRAAQTALIDGGLDVAASRMTTGNHPIYRQLERALVQFFRMESAALASSGYASGLLVAQALSGSVSHVFLDERAHGCLRDAAHWLGVPTRDFRHRDPASLRKQLGRLSAGAKPLIGTDGMFAADGALAPVGDLLELLPENGLLWIDDSHGAGTLGARGRGSMEEAKSRVGARADRLIVTMTLSKAFGCYGGAVLGPAALRERILEKSRLFTGNTPLPPLLAAAAIASIHILKTDPSLRRRLRANTTQLRSALAAEGWPVEASASPVLALTPASDKEAATMRRRLLRAGILPTFIRYPGGPDGGFLRLAVSSEHSAQEVELLGQSLRRD